MQEAGKMGKLFRQLEEHPRMPPNCSHNLLQQTHLKTENRKWSRPMERHTSNVSKRFVMHDRGLCQKTGKKWQDQLCVFKNGKNFGIPRYLNLNN